jgi:hypothetical protein
MRLPHISKSVNELRIHLIEVSVMTDKLDELTDLFTDSAIETLSSSRTSHAGPIATLIIANEKKLHSRIMGEVVRFLASKQNRDSLLIDSITLALATYLWDERNGLNEVMSDERISEVVKSIDCHKLTWGLYSLISTIPWAAEFQRLEAESKQQKMSA